MTVSELIDRLKKYPPETKVMIDEMNTLEGNTFVSNVRFCFPLMRRIKSGKIIQRACKETAGSEKVLVL